MSRRIRIDYENKSAPSEDKDEGDSRAKRKKKEGGDWFKEVTPHVTSAELPMDLFNEEEEVSSDSDTEKESKTIRKDLDPSDDHLPIKTEILEELTGKSEIKKEEPELENSNSSSNETVPGHPTADKPRVPISKYEEERILTYLESSPHLLSKSLFARQFRRKLKVRRLQRERGRPLFDLDQSILRIAESHSVPLHGIKKEEGSGESCDLRVLDRYKLAVPSCISDDESNAFVSFKMKLVGRDEYSRAITSPYTARVLKPYIRRDYESRPLKLKLLMEIQTWRNKNTDLKSYPIDYCYVQPHHIPAINNLAEKFFWPGIDLSECLQYPDFSCVVLYRRIVIAFSFLVPDASCTEAYISFIFTHPEWRRAGIAKFMLYHLIQTCMGKDIILHVSANNPAILLYQKFGFKVEEYIVDFYDKYLPAKSNECKHALLLRLSRY